MELETKQLQDEKIEKLLEEFTKTRDSIYEMITEVEEISKTVKSLFPTADKFDHRYRMIFQERVKATTELFKTLLDMRKEITKSIKDEIELRRKVKSSDSDNIEDLLNISSIMDKIEGMQQSKERMNKVVKSKSEKIEELNFDEIEEDV